MDDALVDFFPLPAGVTRADVAGAMPAAARGPTLRAQLHAIFAALMILLIAALVWQRIDDTRLSVREEIVGANRVASQLLARVSWVVASGGLPAMRGFLNRLGRVPANEITLVNESGATLYRSPSSDYKAGRSAPAWFSTLVLPPLQRQVIFVGAGALTIEADPSRAILDGWDSLAWLSLVAVLNLVLFNAAVFWAVERTLKPFAQIANSLDRLQAGDNSVRLPLLKGREAGQIGLSVNRLAEAIEANVRQRILAHETARSLEESLEWACHLEQRLEGERRQIAADLHDELGQSVTAIRSLAKSLAARLSPDDAMGRDATRLIETEAARLYDAMHAMIPRLAPLDLGPFGLPDALSDLVVTSGRLHPEFRITLRVLDMAAAVDAAPAMAAYRVAQEAVTNAIKHSGGHAIELVLARTGNKEMTLTVQDDGRGLQPAAQHGVRFGLAGMRARVAALGGRFDAGPGPAGGGRVTAQLPLQVSSS